MESYTLLFFAIICFTKAFILKMQYVRIKGTCLECRSMHGTWMGRCYFEYEMFQDGKIKTFQNWGTSCFYIREGKKYMLLVHKKKPNKVIAYNEYIASLVRGLFLITLLVLYKMVSD